MSAADSLAWSRAAAPIWELTSGYSSETRSKKPLAAFQAYVDDSSSDIGDRRLFLAGYINTASRWIRFSNAWEAELKSAPSIDYLKMRDAHRLRGQFNGWLASDRDEKLRGLSRLIRHFRPTSIHCSVSRADYERIVGPVAPYGFSNPYYVCFSTIMVAMANLQLDTPGQNVPIDFIFDNQEGLGEDARFYYRRIREAQPRSVQKLLSVDPVFRDDKLVMPLQAADMLAWHVRRHAEQGGADGFMVPDSICPTGFHMTVDIGRERLERIAKGFSALPGIPSVKTRSSWKKVSAAIAHQVETGTAPSLRATR